ncbi:nitronate monooxygenase [Brevibacterium samyangense]|uniref:Nitronate monooxygenase n=1 Tax=Brevibacterium samyangense TaxID=366888 RepID=A0ABN2T7N9_9MICO
MSAVSRPPFDPRSLRIPLVAAPMLRISDLALTSAVIRAGIVGAFPTLNARSTAGLEEWLTRLDAVQREPGAGPYCPNLVMKDRNALAHAELVARSDARLVITSVGSPAPVADLFADAGIAVFSDVATVEHARKAAAAGVTGLVLLTAGAGGQTGWLNPFAFVTAVREFFDGPLVLAGGMTGGRSLAAARVAGYDLAYAGTAFMAAAEAPTRDDHARLLVDSGPDDVVLTRAFTGLPTNMLRASIEASGLDPENLDEDVTPEDASDLFGNRAREIGPKRWTDVQSAGHSVAGVHALEPAASIVDRFAREYRAALADVHAPAQSAPVPTADRKT